MISGLTIDRAVRMHGRCILFAFIINAQGHFDFLLYNEGLASARVRMRGGRRAQRMLCTPALSPLRRVARWVSRRESAG